MASFASTSLFVHGRTSLLLDLSVRTPCLHVSLMSAIDWQPRNCLHPPDLDMHRHVHVRHHVRPDHHVQIDSRILHM